MATPETTHPFDSHVYHPGDLAVLKRAFDRLRGPASHEDDDLAFRLLAIFRTGAVTEDELVEAATAWPSAAGTRALDDVVPAASSST